MEVYRPGFESSLYCLLFMKEKFAKLLNSQASIFSIRDWKDGMATSQGPLRDLNELIRALAHTSHEPGTVHWKKKKIKESILITFTF